MRNVKSEDIISEIEKMCADVNYNLPCDVAECVASLVKNDKSIQDNILLEILQNAQVAAKEHIALCQDTGTANFFVKIGKNVMVDKSILKKMDIQSGQCLLEEDVQ